MRTGVLVRRTSSRFREVDAIGNGGRLLALLSGMDTNRILHDLAEQFPLSLRPHARRVLVSGADNELRRLCATLRQRLAASKTTQSHLAEALVAEVA